MMIDASCMKEDGMFSTLNFWRRLGKRRWMNGLADQNVKNDTYYIPRHNLAWSIFELVNSKSHNDLVYNMSMFVNDMILSTIFHQFHFPKDLLLSELIFKKNSCPSRAEGGPLGPTEARLI